jgi:hypothetical protein
MDGQAMLTPTGAAHFGTPAWVHEYARRVDRVMDALDRNGRRTYWIALPQMRDGELSARMATINDIVARVARRHAGVHVVETWELTAGADGAFSSRLPGGPGRVLARAQDGVHFTAAGADVVAREVVRQLQRDWRF